jgi:Bacterial SH3 domain
MAKKFLGVLVLVGLAALYQSSVSNSPNKTYLDPKPRNIFVVAPAKKEVAALPTAVQKKAIAPKPEKLKAPRAVRILYVGASKLNLRDTPSKNGKKLGELIHGAPLRVTEENLDWVRVEQEEGYSLGWVNRAYLRDTKPPKPKPKNVLVKDAEAYLDTLPKQEVKKEKSFIAPLPKQTAILLPQTSRGQTFTYTGRCACPDDVDSAGRRCGRRSAYSRAGGASPTCNGSNILAYEAPSTAPVPSYKPLPQLDGYGAISNITGRPKTTYVRGYYRKNGTYVRPHYRSRRR